MTAPVPTPDTIFLAAIEIDSADERAAYLARACGADSELHARVEKLVLAHFQAGSFLEKPPQQLIGTGAYTPSTEIHAPAGRGADREGPGTRIGPYQLLEQLGEGGMGTVWMAEQNEPVQRHVALKLIKAGLDSRQVVARFEAERQTLALMDHPNIARVFDGGTTETGLPFFVMEMVQGVPLTKYCDDHKLTPRERLELFTPVCQAVQHAHQKGIIHRDLKPSNVMVCLYDGKPVPKVIDFGIAKATGQQLTERTMFTEIGQVVGTLEYMSPEQAELNQLDIDTRSDIYSLGVLLYELLTGTTPLERKRLREAAFLEVLRLIREEEPQKPSTRLSTTEELPGIAANRGLEPKKLSGLVRGELDWIVMKALEKDRNRRYETANGFAADVQRYLNDEPVSACPPSAWYRFRKMARRNRVALTTTAVVAVTLLLATVVSVWQAIEVTRAWTAERNTQAHLTLAETEKDKQVVRINKEITDALGELAVLRTGAKGVSLADAKQRAVFQEARKRAESLAASEVADRDQVEKLRDVLTGLKQEEADRRMAGRLEDLHIGSNRDLDKRNSSPAGDKEKDTFVAAFRDYGIPVPDLEIEEAARRVRDSAIREELVAALDAWAGPDIFDGWGGALNEKLLRIAQRVVEDPWRQRYFDARLLPRDPEKKALKALIELARRPEAPEQQPLTVSMLSRSLGRAEPETSIRLLQQAQVRYSGDLLINYELAKMLSNKEVEGESRSSIGMRVRAQDRSKKAMVYYRIALALRPDNRDLLHTMATELTEATEFDEAIACYRQCYRLLPQATNYLLMIGYVHREKKDWDGAIAVYRELLDRQPRERRAYWGIGMALCEKGAFDEALPVFEEAVRREPLVSEPHAGLGWALEGKGRLDESLKEYRESLRLEDPKESWRPALIFPAPDAVLGILHVLQKQKVADPVRAAFQEAVRHMPARGPGWLPAAPIVARTIAEEMTLKGDLDAVIAVYQEAEKFQPGSLTEEYRLELADALLAKDRLDEAISNLEAVAKPGSYYHVAFFKLGMALARKGQWEQAEKRLKQAIQLLPWEPNYHFLLGNILARQRKFDEAVAAYRQVLRWAPTSYQAYDRLANTLAEQGKLDEAVTVYRDLLAFYTNPPDAHRNLGVVLARQGKQDEAIAAYRTAIRYVPRDALAHYHLGNALAQQDKLGDAIASYQEAVRLSPNLAEAHAALKSTRARQEKPDEALAALREAIRLQPRDAQAHYRLGNTLARLDRLDEAVSAYRTALTLRPDDGLVLHDLGVVLTRQDKLDEAIAACRDAVRLLPDDVQARYDLGYALSRQGKLDEAVAVFREVLRRKPDFPEAHGNLGVALFRQGKLDDAVAVYRKVIQLRPDDAIAHHNLAQALFQQGKFDEALAASREALRLQPNEALAHSSQGAALLRQDRIVEAIAACHEALARRPDLADAHITLDSALPRMKALNESIANQRKALSQQPDDQTAYSNLAVSLVKAGKFDEAIQFKPGPAGAQQLANTLDIGPLLDRAISDCRQLLRRRPNDVSLRFFLGIALYRRGSRDEAIALFSEWINLEPRNREFLIARGQLNRRDPVRGGSALADIVRATELDPNDAATWALRADLESEGYKFPEAEEHYSQAIKLKPGFASYWSARGYLYVRQRQWDNAVADYTRALELLPRPNPDYLTTRGDAYVKLEQWDRAVADYVQATKAYPNYSRPWDRHTELHAQRGEWDKAIAVCAEGADKTRYLPLRTRLAWLLATCPDARLRDPARAIQIVKDTPKLLPGYMNSPDDWAVLGAAHYRAGDWKAALEALTKGAGPGQVIPVREFFLAMTHHQLGSKDEARKAYGRAVQGMAGVVSWVEYLPVKYEELRRFGAEAEELLGPSAEDLPALMARGRASYQFALWAHALADFSRATVVAPKDAEAWNWRGQTQVRLKQWDRAVADFSTAMKLSPTRAAYRQSRGDAHAANEEWDKALADYNAVLENKDDPSSAVQAGTARANLHIRLGQWDKALADYVEFSQKMPKMGYHWRPKLAWLLVTCPDAKLRDPARALEVLKEVPVWLPPAMTALGAAHYRAGNCKAAVETLTRALEADKGSSGSVSFFLAMAHWQLGQKEEARKCYDRAVGWMEKNQPKDEELRRFQKEAAEVLGLETSPKKDSPPK